jgi:hypothetical protein
MALAGWIAAQDLRLALGPVSYMAIFDDSTSKSIATVDASLQVAQVLNLSAAEVASYMPILYPDVPPQLPAAVSQLLAGAQLDYSRVLSYRRHPEYIKTYDAGPGGKMEELFREKMLRIQQSVQQISPQDAPALEDPGNVGGNFADDGKRLICTSPDGTDNLGDF